MKPYTVQKIREETKQVFNAWGWGESCNPYDNGIALGLLSIRRGNALNAKGFANPSHRLSWRFFKNFKAIGILNIFCLCHTGFEARRIDEGIAGEGRALEPFFIDTNQNCSRVFGLIVLDFI